MLTPAQRQHRMNVRNFFMVATVAELEVAVLANPANNPERGRFIQELLEEARLDEELAKRIEEARLEEVAKLTEDGYDKLAGGWVG